MKAHTYEKAFLITGGIVLALCASALVVANALRLRRFT